VNWKANNSKISQVCNNPYTNALTTNAHVSVAVYVSRQPTCLVYVFRVAVRETYKSCGCYVVLYVYGCKGTYFPSHSNTFCYLFTDSYHFQGLKGLTSLLFYANYLFIPPYTIPLPLTGERDVSFWRYGVRCFISVTLCLLVIKCFLQCFFDCFNTSESLLFVCLFTLAVVDCIEGNTSAFILI